MKKIYSYFGTWLFVLITITVVLPQTVFAQTHSNTTLKPVLTNNRKTERINNLEARISANLQKIKKNKSWYIYHKANIKKVKKIINDAIVNIALLYTEKILTTEISYDPKILAASTKALRDELKSFIKTYRTKLRGFEEIIDLLEKRNIQLQNEINLLLASTRNKSSTQKVPDNKISLQRGDNSVRGNLTGGETLSEKKQNLEKLQKEKDLLNASTVNPIEEHDNYYIQKCPDQNPGDPQSPNRKRYKFDTNNNPDDGDYVLCGYWKNGDLAYEIPHANNKRHGIAYYNLYNSSNPKSIIPYTEGKKDGTSIDFLKTGEGKIYKRKESEYSEGKLRSTTIFTKDGNVGNISYYYSNGRKEKEYWYRKDRKTRECWYRYNGGTGKCKTY